MSTDTRERRAVAAVACPLCGAEAGKPCRNPIQHQAQRGPEDHRPQPQHPHRERRAAWLEWKRKQESQ